MAVSGGSTRSLRFVKSIETFRNERIAFIPSWIAGGSPRPSWRNVRARANTIARLSSAPPTDLEVAQEHIVADELGAGHGHDVDLVDVVEQGVLGEHPPKCIVADRELRSGIDDNRQGDAG